jgi:hypothetical protein
VTIIFYFKLEVVIRAIQFHSIGSVYCSLVISVYAAVIRHEGMVCESVIHGSL